ncbi:ABC transporter substrate-binding protein [Jiangella alba]|uniref:Carbohydrate ABC transporter substrate-binding protein, CUT1 family n=1 Tax=Jiangella alba TaxID=561176 RepID=A0A1H5PNB6_9ACTN|nr:sugar ABC transporter substrate-binding protein [Jiangella alba]SEF15255.1 carbohydrate ABC transporter substrate-binding protein, CUT1 family [Jiangella alba]
MARHSGRRRWSVGLAAAATLTLTLAACGSGDDAAESTGEAVDDGTTITMWVRAATAAQSQALVDAYNASHENQVQLTVVPTDNYLQKVGVAAGSGDLPDLLASDVIYTPNFTSKNMYLDITDRVEQLDFADALAPSHMQLGTYEGETYTVPHNVAVSALFQNDVLLEQAGVDPSVAPATLADLAANAEKVAALGGDAVGLYYTGNNGGSISFTHFPAIWASGGEPLNDDGTAANLDSPEVVEVFQAFNDMFASGATADAVRNESGPTRDEVFAGGNVGYMLASNSVLQNVTDTDQLKIGVNGIPGTTGDVSTFVGGDVIGISANSERADAAWDFLSWSLSEDAQLEVFAKSDNLTVRTDLADNEYAAADPRQVTLNELIAKGHTPYALNYGQTFNDPNGPWLEAARGALFGDDAAGALSASLDAVNSSLAR